MLVLTRRIGERIVIDGGIVIELLETDRGKVRLGIEAPPDVVIKREELLTADERAKLPARAGRSNAQAVTR